MHVLVPLDDSDPARDALEHAIETYPDAEITALHVLNPPTALYGASSQSSVDRLIDLEESAAEELLESAEQLADEHDASVTTELLVGSPARAIVSFASENDVDQIVLGSHGRSGVSRVLLGSVAESVVRRAPVPVTILR
ncbi:universal stress protein [Natronolimnohabitans innermongolicus]|uniref:UspA domain-containing protein n=1 Tax=Natronolimnohabitans innermongolicus JCM 12255 TaxID=1227499 RepID=L9XB85_9EURY|nr:universal stress protein [Natronolimnohabitans innermongolicus]ELY58696.1 UspA domain-containing protein [Natronolimnohabitans innermongolicus JCM 12255]